MVLLVCEVFWDTYKEGREDDVPGGNGKSQYKIFLFLSSVACRITTKTLHRFNDFSCGSVKVIKELFCSFSERSGKKSHKPILHHPNKTANPSALFMSLDIIPYFGFGITTCIWKKINFGY